MKLPNFIVIGAPKCGTTSLYFYLKQHPEIFLPKTKELHYFSFPELGQFSSGPGDADVLAGLCQTWEQYTQQYQDENNQLCIGDISPSYLYYSSSARKIFERLGLVKTIVIVRNPVEKAYSQYMHNVRDGLETLSFDQAIASESIRREKGWGDIWRYAESSLYAERLKEFIKIFGKDRVKIILFEDFVKNTSSTLTDIFEYLGVDKKVAIATEKQFNRSGTSRYALIAYILRNPSFLKHLFKLIVPIELRQRLRNWLMNINTGKKPEMNVQLRMILLKYFRDDVAQVETIIGKPTNWLVP